MTKTYLKKKKKKQIKHTEGNSEIKIKKIEVISKNIFIVFFHHYKMN